jgi:phosphoesterase RecJ-like protein
VADRKAFLLRIDPAVLEAVQRWANDDLRSLNAHIEFLLRDALNSLGVDETHGIAWISVTADALERYEVSPEDLDGIVEHPRSIAGTRLALFFRDLGYGKVKVSFRSTGDVDVNRFARQFGGGGHAKASGALITGTLDQVRDRVVNAARDFIGPVGGNGLRPDTH